uniref:Uncharacterized protein n=1 Tax=Anguilla anguilla TaxID=7936 RepID=A0A0E9R7I9_ANGAN
MSHNFRTFSKEQLFNSIKYCNSLYICQYDFVLLCTENVSFKYFCRAFHFR